jgi:Spy/CpxP family protein refolding chaperone
MKTGLGLLKFVLVLAVLATATAVLAQAPEGGRRGQGGGRGGPGNNPLMLLQAEPVQKELSLTDDQKSSISKLADEQRDLSREDRQQKAEETRKQLAEILKPEQRERLEQIGLQLAGGRALTRPDIAEKLGLSEEQKTKLNELFPARRGGGGGAPGGEAGGPPGGGQGGGAGNFRAMREETNSKAMEILTSEQRSQFEKMQGKKVDIDPAQLFRGGRGPGGAGGQGNRPNPDT